MKKSTTTKQKVLILVMITLLFLGLFYAIGVIYFSSHFSFGTTINGITCERMTVQEVKDRLQSNISKYSLSLLLRNDKTETISASDLDMTYVDDHGVEELLEDQKPFLWFSYMFRPTNLEVSANITYDTSRIASIVGDLDCMQIANITAPVDAQIIESDGHFSITPEVIGTTILRQPLINSIIEAVDAGKTELDLEASGLYQNPNVYSSDEALIKKLEALNTLAVANITYDMGDNRIYTLDSSILKDWVIQAEDGSYTIDKDQAYNFIKQMAYDTDTFGLSHQFKTSYGKTITLAKGGDYGWVIHKTKTMDALIEAIQNQTQGTLEPVYLYEGKDRGINDIGDTYVEICIQDQMMWCYKDGKLVVKTPVVTGNHSTGYDTPSGSVWAIDAKKKDVSFTLYDADVTFWLPFNDQVGIHDASWRSDDNYMPSTYLTNGSHGCINTPYAAAEKVFNAMNIGYPVVVYYSVDQPVGPQPTQETRIG